MAAHADLAAGLRQLIDTRAEDPMNLPWCSLCRIDIDLNTRQCECDHLGFGMEIVTAEEVTDPYIRAAHHTPRLIGSGLRHNIPLGNTRHCPGCETPVHPQTLACACFTPTRKDT